MTSGLAAERVYIYSFWTGDVKEYVGTLYVAGSENAIFISKIPKKRFYTSLLPLEVFNGTVWMFQSDPKAAKVLFAENIKSKIDLLREQIITLEKKLAYLKGE